MKEHWREPRLVVQMVLDLAAKWVVYWDAYWAVNWLQNINIQRDCKVQHINGASKYLRRRVAGRL